VNGNVLFGDVVRSRRDAGAATAWLRTLTDELGEVYPADRRLARFEFTQGDEVQGLLAPGADPLAGLLRAWTHPDALTMRWVIVAGAVDPGRGPATQRTGAAFLQARERLAEAASRRDRLVMATGDPPTDEILDGVAPLLAELLGELTERQRVIARLLLVEEMRQSQAAEHLNVSRATISVAADRAHVRSIGRLADALRILFRNGQAAAGVAE
jgi:DNA-binding NarL/FixJ family response regulator